MTWTIAWRRSSRCAPACHFPGGCCAYNGTTLTADPAERAQAASLTPVGDYLLRRYPPRVSTHWLGDDGTGDPGCCAGAHPACLYGAAWGEALRVQAATLRARAAAMQDTPKFGLAKLALVNAAIEAEALGANPAGRGAPAQTPKDTP